MIIHLSQSINTHLGIKPISQHGTIYQNLNNFLSLLQVQLGLFNEETSQSQRIIQYLHCLHQKDNLKRFYHKSFGVDELGVAKKLLNWRDELYLAGWNGFLSNRLSNKSSFTASKRLKDLAEVEKLAIKNISPNQGQQLESILERLQTYQTQIKQIQLYEYRHLLPQQWQRVLEQLEKQGIDIIPLPKVDYQGKKGSDLAQLQKILQTTLYQDKSATKPYKLKGDGSVLVIKSQSKTNSAQLIAQYVSSIKQTQDTIVLAQREQKLLEQQMIKYDLPNPDFHQSSPSRSILQLLPLSLQLYWEPIDLNKMLSFLQHPINFIPKFSREILADTIASYPGIGGQHWDKAIEEIKQKCHDQFNYDQKQIKHLIKKIEYWLNSNRYDSKVGAPIESLIERIKLINDHFQSQIQFISQSLVDENNNADKYKKAELNLLYQAVNDCSELDNLLQLLSSQGNRTINQLKLKQILDMVIASGSPLPLNNKQANAPIIIDNPALLFTPTKELIWWDMAYSNAPFQRTKSQIPWTKKEIDYLQTQSVYFQKPSEQLITQEEQALNSIANAQNRLVIILHEGEEHHPLWDKISTLAYGWAQFTLELELANNRSKLIPQLKVPKLIQTQTPLPTRKRWWRLKKSNQLATQLAKRKVESYSSLNALINSPYQWVLNYKAYLRSGNLQSISQGNQLKGTFSHELFENFFKHYAKSWQRQSIEAISKWFHKTFDQMIKEQAVIFLAAGKISEQEELRETLYRALINLISHLKSAKIKSIAMESENKQTFFGGKITGFIDMLLTNDKGDEIVLDLKWGSEKYKAQELENNLHSQLALYAYMRKKQTKAKLWPEQAYYIISTSHLLAQNNFTFSNALVHAPEDGASVATLYKQLENSYQWRREQINQGEIEMTIGGTQADDNSIAPDNALVIDEENDFFNNYVNLMGWDE